MALVGLVRVSTAKQETARQHDALGPICVKVFEEKVSGKLALADRPVLQAAIDYMREGDMLAVQEIDRLGRNTIEGLQMLAALFDRGIAVKVLDGVAKGDHAKGSIILTLALAIAQERREDIVRKTKNGLEAARKRGKVGGRPSVVDADKRRVIIARHENDEESVRTIAKATGVSVGTVHKVISEHRTAELAQTSPSGAAP